jgi:Ca2+-binding EF-hand superfamily protein
MRERVESQTLQDIAIYMDKQKYSLKDLFDRFDTDDKDGLGQEEFYEMLKEININVTQ